MHTVRDVDLDSAAALAAEFCAVWRVIRFAEQAAFVRQSVKRGDRIPRAEPWCANHLKGFGCAPPVGKVCAFQQAGARVNERAIHGRNCGGRRYERQRGFIIKEAARHACAGDDGQRAADVLRFIDKARKFTDGQAGAHGSRIFPDEGGKCRVEDVALWEAADHGRSIQNNERNARSGAGFHGFRHGVLIGIIARAHILHVEKHAV